MAAVERKRAKLSFTLAPESVERLRSLAADSGRSMSAVLDSLILDSGVSARERREAWDLYVSGLAPVRGIEASVITVGSVADSLLEERDRRFPPCE